MYQLAGSPIGDGQFRLIFAYTNQSHIRTALASDGFALIDDIEEFIHLVKTDDRASKHCYPVRTIREAPQAPIRTIPVVFSMLAQPDVLAETIYRVLMKDLEEYIDKPTFRMFEDDDRHVMRCGFPGWRWRPDIPKSVIFFIEKSWKLGFFDDLPEKHLARIFRNAASNATRQAIQDIMSFEVPEHAR